ncbi:MAG: type III-A CRISPR-associated protein Cas10/Csm1 [Pseudomonadota bacterium]
MDETTLKIALAGLMHDVGKFVDREIVGITREYVNNHADLYQPFYEGRHTHAHVVFTAGFVEHLADVLPPQLNDPHWGDGDAFINLAAGHHKPDSPLQWIVAVADRLSSGWDRRRFDEYNRQIPWRDYKKTRLHACFEHLDISSGNGTRGTGPPSFCYPLLALSPLSIFPGQTRNVVPESREKAEYEYRMLFEEFVASLGRLLHAKESVELWLEHFDSLMMTYTCSIPSARAGDVVPDVSLYDHSRTTAALAAALYLYHRDSESLTVDAVKEYEPSKFLLVTGDFYGIQDFIFSTHGDVRRYRSKLLRGRSFQVSLFSELTALTICREMGLPSTSVLLNAAGRFTLVAPNTPQAIETVGKVEKTVNDWLVKISFGESTIGLTSREATPDDFVLGRFPDLWDGLQHDMQRKKYAKVDLDAFAGSFSDYLKGFEPRLDHPLCPLCGRRPSSTEIEGSDYVEKAGSACAICRDHLFLGTNLVKKPCVAVTTLDANLGHPRDRLAEPLFGRYQVAFLDGPLNQLARTGHLLKYWNLALPTQGASNDGIAVKFINGYVPVNSEDDRNDDRLPAGGGSEKRTSAPTDEITIGDPKNFNRIAAKALNPRIDREGFRGVQALGVMKADVDHLGVLLACGISREKFTLSRLATLSRQLDFYFSVYMSHLLAGDERFCDVYTVFAGGDDLFLVGPWNRIIELSSVIQDSFARYVCHNPDIHLSAGISLHKPHTPMDKMAAAAESALERSKYSGRNSVTVFDETVQWDELTRLKEIGSQIKEWLNKGWVSKSMLYRLNHFIDMAQEEHLLRDRTSLRISEMEYTKWRAYLTYSTERNAAPGLRGEERRRVVAQVIEQTRSWLLEHGGKLRIPLWNVLYNIR